jgi:TorA maturation chaperone TorD
MNQQILTWAYEFLQRVDLNAKEVPAFIQVMQAFEDVLKQEDTAEPDNVTEFTNE